MRFSEPYTLRIVQDGIDCRERLLSGLFSGINILRLRQVLKDTQGDKIPVDLQEHLICKWTIWAGICGISFKEQKVLTGTQFFWIVYRDLLKTFHEE